MLLVIQSAAYHVRIARTALAGVPRHLTPPADLSRRRRPRHPDRSVTDVRQSSLGCDTATVGGAGGQRRVHLRPTAAQIHSAADAAAASPPQCWESTPRRRPSSTPVLGGASGRAPSRSGRAPPRSGSAEVCSGGAVLRASKAAGCDCAPCSAFRCLRVCARRGPVRL